MRACLCLPLLLLGMGALPALAQDAELPPGDNKPLLRLEGGGPIGNVTALAFSPDGKRLYAAGFDKVVRVWALDGKTGKFVLDGTTTYRVPIGPGMAGAINALALSADGSWLAVGGLGVIRGGSGFYDVGKLWPAVGGLTAAMQQDEGLIYVFHTAKREVRLLRGHTGAVRALAFAAGDPALLVSAALGRKALGGQRTGEVRVWIVDKQATVAARADLPAPMSSQPALVAFRTGAGPAQLRVALAWGDSVQSLRLWDLARADKQLQVVKDGKYNNVIALDHDQKRVYTGSFRGLSGRLQAWDVSGAAPAEERGVNLNQGLQGVFYFPRALALVGSKPGTAEQAALVVRQPKDGTEQDYLQLIDLRGGSFGGRLAHVPLWKNTALLPILAAAPGGRHVAVAGNLDHSIFVYTVADLLNGQNRPQLLRNAGATLRSVGFVTRADKKGRRLGLLVGEEPGQPGNLVFDFKNRALTADGADWTPDAPDLDGWSVEKTIAKDRTVVTVYQGNQATVKLDRWRGAHRVDAVAVLPPLPPLKVPLVAVASYDLQRGEPLLDIYHARTGEQVRRFLGHLAPARALAFSRDGRLLTSAADDHTVCVWSLTNLGDILGQFGALQGVAVSEGDKDKVLVEQVQDDSPARGQLQPEDLVVGLVGKGDKVQALKSPHAFYDAMMMVKPGEAVTLRVQTPGAQPRDVKLTVGQGVDVCKPLLTLFLTRAQEGQARGWLGWHPEGPYDSSGAEVEKYLGWHFNTASKEAPTAFALIDQYRKEYYRRGILARLVAHGNLRDALEKVERPMPHLSLTALAGDAEAGQTQDGHRFVRQHEGVRLQLAIDNYTPEPGDTVTWQLGDGALQKFAKSEDGTYRSEPLPLPARSGIYTARAVVRLAPVLGQAEEYAELLTLRYQPPAPSVEVAPPAAGPVVDAARFAFKATVRRGLPEQEATVTLIHKAAGQEKKDSYTVGKDEPLQIAREFTLAKGENLFTVIAESKSPLRDYEENERTIRSVQVIYQPKPVPQPVIVLKAIHPAAGAAPGLPREIVAGQAVVVEVPEVRIQGRITIKGGVKLKEAQWAKEAEQPRPLAGFKAGAADAHDIDQPVDLKPGPQTFRILARAEGGMAAEETVAVFYRPQLPQLVLTAPERGAVLYEVNKENPAEVVVEGKLFPPSFPSHEPFPMSAAVLVNGRQVLAMQRVEAGATELSFPKVPLQPGENRIQLKLSHAWGGEPVVAAVEVRYLRPPRILKLQQPKVGAKPFVDLEAEVYSALPPLPAVRVEVNKAGSNLTGAQVLPDPKRPDVYMVRLAQVPLLARDNSVSLWVRNAEAESLQPGQLAKVVYAPPAPPPRPKPQVVILEPGADSVSVAEPKLAVRFRVKSEGPLQRVVLKKGERELFSLAPAVLAAMKRDPQGFEFNTAKLTLDWGLNDLRVEALDDGGEARTALTVNVLARPVQLDLDLLQPQGVKAEAVRPALSADGRLAFPAVGPGRVWLHGTVRWSSKDDDQLKGAGLVRVYVNGFQQAAAALPQATDSGREGKFKADLLLAPGDNTVEVVLPGLKQDAGNRREFAVVRQSPAAPQDPRPHLHVLVVAPGQRDGAGLKERLLAALRADSAGPGLDLYRTRMFDQVRIDLLAGYVPQGAVFTRLRQLEAMLGQRAARGFTNDVVMVYYLGPQTETALERFYWTSETRSPVQIRNTALNLQFLADRYFDRFAGAQLLLLDVAPAVQGSALNPATASRPVPSWNPEYRFAVLRHTWLGGSADVGRARLLSALQQKLPQATGLTELASALADVFRPAAGQAGLDWAFDDYLPAHLRLRLNNP